MTNEPVRWNVLGLAKAAAEVLEKKASTSARLDADLLLAHVLGCDRLKLYVNFDMPVSDDDRGRFREMVKRRLTGEPVAYIIGRREFLDWSFAVDKNVLIPRPDTEDVVKAAVEEVERAGEGARVVDIGTGSGCIAISIALMRKTATVVATDLSAEALNVASANATRLGAAVTFHRGDLFAALPADEAPFHVVCSNPPYITRAEAAELEKDVHLFEPHLALFSPQSGLFFHERILREARTRLISGGSIIFELPGYGGAELIAKARAAGIDADFSVKNDLGGHERAFVARGVRYTE